MSLQSAVMQFGSIRTASERAEQSCILTINGGSSSLKFALFALGDRPARLLSGRVERVGMPSSPAGSSPTPMAARGGATRTVEGAGSTLAAAVNLLIQLPEYVVGPEERRPRRSSHRPRR